MNNDAISVTYNPYDDILKFNEFAIEVRRNIIEEGAVLTGLVGLGAATMIVGKDRMLDFITNIVNSIIGIIKFALEQLRRIWKLITIRAKDVYASNNTFLYRYGAKLNEILNNEVMINGYDMNTDIMSLVNNLSVEARTSSNELVFISDILNGNFKFSSKEDMLMELNRTRAEILDIHAIGSRSNVDNYIKGLDNFEQALNTKVYGFKRTSMFKVSDAVAVIKSYDQRIESLMAACKVIDEQGNKELQKLSALKDSFSSGKIIKVEVRDDVIKQFNWLIEYKQRSLNDFLLAFNILAQYTNDINIQAKTICIKALQDN